MFNYYFLVADTDLCLSVAKLQVTRVPEVFWSQIPISACLFQSSKLPEFQKFLGHRYRSLPVCCKVPSYQSSRSWIALDSESCIAKAHELNIFSTQSSKLREFSSILASNCDLYLFNSKFPSFESFKFPKLQFHPRILPYLIYFIKQKSRMFFL